MCSRRDPQALDRIAQLGSVHLPEGRVKDTHEKESPLAYLRPEGRCPGNIAVPAISACSRYRPIPWIFQGYVRIPTKLENLLICPKWVLYGPECGLSSGPACALLDHAVWECPPSRGRVMDMGEKESPLIILRPEDRWPTSYLGLWV
ncbi:hypothetical protein CRG98_010461 [Punica granatum]|uniref:Uncharacterized protein n=1 Tax=Punica granatum TaxID=22663 RepID=A0A2I0KMU4_PUNGR|nr:hypothetical protein CRG98_010461 [Punica granatum]